MDYDLPELYAARPSMAAGEPVEEMAGVKNLGRGSAKSGEKQQRTSEHVRKRRPTRSAARLGIADPGPPGAARRG
jgi:hypothetical protein